MERDGNNLSFWQRNDFTKTYESGDNQSTFDVVIIGGGITGLSTALELQRKGKSCVVVEQKNLGFGTTGGTTAHINNFFDTTYAELIDQLGAEKTKTILETAKKVLPYIKDNIQKLHISCEFSECNYYLFSAEEKQDQELEDILKAHYTVGLSTKKVYDIHFDIEFRNAIEIQGQGQFNPIKYIHGLAKEFTALGGVISTNTKFIDYESGKESIKVITNKNEFTCTQLIFATHIPPGNTRFSLLASPYRSYVITALLANPPKQLGQAADLYDPYHYFRYHKDGEQYYIIVGGFDHKTGQQDPEKSFTDLEDYVTKNFQYKEILYRWSSQYYTPADGLPYIGRMPGEENIFIATGYDGNGMTWGTISAFIISDLLGGHETEISKIVDPKRISLIDSAKSLITENVKNTVHIVKETVSPTVSEDTIDIPTGSGAIVKHDGKTVAAYKDEHGAVHYLSPACPHMGCNVVFNDCEKSWDCPCHGSRFAIDGILITGPSKENLKPLNL